MGKDPAGQEITAAWISKEKLRDALNLRARVTGSVPCERDVRGRLFAFYDWCARNDDIPGLLSLARTVSRWENEIVAAVLPGIVRIEGAPAEPGVGERCEVETVLERLGPYLKTFRTKNRRSVAPTMYKVAPPVCRQAVVRLLRTAALPSLTRRHVARASP